MVCSIPGAANESTLGALLDHLLAGDLVRVEDAADINVKVPPELVLGHVDGRLDLADARVGNHGPEGANLGDVGVDNVLDVAALGHVAQGHVGLVARRLGDFVRRRLGLGLHGRQVRDGDAEAVRGKALGDALATVGGRFMVNRQD